MEIMTRNVLKFSRASSSDQIIMVYDLIYYNNQTHLCTLAFGAHFGTTRAWIWVVFWTTLDGSFLEPLPFLCARKEISHVNGFIFNQLDFAPPYSFSFFFKQISSQNYHSLVITEVTTFSEATDWLYGLIWVQNHSL